MRPRPTPAVKQSIIAAALCLFAVVFVDGPVARLFAASPLFHHQQKYAVGTPWLLVPLILVIAFVVFAHGKGRFKAARKIAIVATISAVGAFISNDAILKPLFGRTSINEYLFWPKHYGFYFFQGNWHSNFPSGHMALLVAGVAVLWGRLPRWRWLFGILLAISGFVLLFGEWHFVSDLIAGALWGNLVALAVVALSNKNPKRTLFRASDKEPKAS